MKAVITGMGMYVPQKIVSNDDLTKLMDTSDEWIVQRSGIKTRRHTDGTKGASDLALKASIEALKSANLQAEDIDLIIVSTLSPDYYFPGVGVFLQSKLGLETTPALDIRAQCSGFIYGLHTVKAFIESGMYKRILLVGAEVQSAALNFNTAGRETAVLFGDGAGACVFEATDDNERGILNSNIYSQGEFRDKLKIEFPSCVAHPFVNAEAILEDKTSPHMDGSHVFKNAVSRMTEVVTETCKSNNMTVDEVDFFIFHQANLRINEMVSKKLAIPSSKSYNNIDKYGNCSSASIPMCIKEASEQGLIKKGDTLCLTAFGAGYTWGCVIIRF